MENLERQLEEIGVLEAIYPDELTVDATSVESARELLEKYRDEPDSCQTTSQLPNLCFTIHLAQLARLEQDGKLKHSHPSITLEFPQEYPENSPPIVTNASGFDSEMMAIVQENLGEHSGEECTMQIVMSINDMIQTRNESTEEDYENRILKREQEKESKANLHEKTDSKQILGRRVINSPYILKPAKIKDIKKCADELGLGGFAKVGKPGIIVIEGPEEGCKQYCPMLEDRGWKYQKVQGEETQEGGTVDELRAIHNAFRILPEDTTMSELSKLCKEAGLGDFFFASLNIHDSSAERGKEGSLKKSGKR